DVVKRWLAVAGWMAVIFYLSTMQVRADYGSAAPSAVHFVEYAILAVLVRWASSGIVRASAISLDFAAIIFATIYGGSMEIAQRFVPTRSPDIMDALVNAAGALVGVVVPHLISSRKARSRDV
ncbi:MAG: VanZ family protein, partial [Chloroflexi bacterium]|nr:VanZ family protein [Chloroflexota bacterium]